MFCDGHWKVTSRRLGGLLLLVGGGFVLGGLLAGCAEQPQREGPAAQIVGSPVHDFGSRFLGEQGTHRFQIQNVGTETLQILDTKSSCGCAVLQVEHSSVAPGEVTAIVATYTPDKVAEKLRKSLWVTTSDPQQSELRFEFLAEVDDLYRSSPPIYDYGNCTAGAIAEAELVVQRVDTKPFQILSAVEHAQLTDVRWEELDGHRYRIRFRPRDNLGVGAKRWALKFLTDQERQPELTVFAEALVQPPYVANLRRLDFGEVNAAEGGSMEFRVLAQGVADSVPLRELVVVSKINREFPNEPPWVAATAAAGERELTVTVTVRKGAPVSSLLGRIDVQLSDPAFPILSVVLSGSVAESM